MNGSALHVSHAQPAGEATPNRVQPSAEALWLQHVDYLLWIATAAFIASLALIVSGG